MTIARFHALPRPQGQSWEVFTAQFSDPHKGALVPVYPGTPSVLAGLYCFKNTRLTLWGQVTVLSSWDLQTSFAFLFLPCLCFYPATPSPLHFFLLHLLAKALCPLPTALFRNQSQKNLQGTSEYSPATCMPRSNDQGIF